LPTDLPRFPQAPILSSHAGIQLFLQLEREIACDDQVWNVGKITQPMRRRQARSELQLDQFFKRNESNRLTFDAGSGAIID
jgi:hypothetical protein